MQRRRRSWRRRLAALLLAGVLLLVGGAPSGAGAAHPAGGGGGGVGTLLWHQLQHLRGVPDGTKPQPLLTYPNYTVTNSRDTFELCREESGITRHHEVPLEGLLPVFRLPADLTQRQSIDAGALVQQTHPGARVEQRPMAGGGASRAVRAGLSPGRLPRLVHFTVRDKASVAPYQAISIASWAALNPGYSIMLWDDADIGEFMAAHFPQLLPMFEGLETKVERTDLWRYLVLCVFGGVYADSDVVAAKPIDEWAPDAGLLVGIENVFPTPEAAAKRTYTRQVQMVQWVIGARRQHPVVCRMGDYVARRVAREVSGEVRAPDHDASILERTGPGIWSSSVHDYLTELGVAPVDVAGGRLVGDVRVLPQTVFGCASATFNLSDPTPYVYHMFKGSWRQPPPPSNLPLQLARRVWGSMFGGGSAAGAANTAPPQQPPARREQSPSSGAGGGGAALEGVMQGGAAHLRLRAAQQQAQPHVVVVVQQAAASAAAAPPSGAHSLPMVSLLLLVAMCCTLLLQRNLGGRLRASFAGSGLGALLPLAHEGGKGAWRVRSGPPLSDPGGGRCGPGCGGGSSGGGGGGGHHHGVRMKRSWPSGGNMHQC